MYLVLSGEEGPHKKKLWELGEIKLKMTKSEFKRIVPNKLHFLGPSLHWPISEGWEGVVGDEMQGEMSPGAHHQLLPF